MSKKSFDRESRRSPAYCYLFDCLYLDGRSLLNDPQDRRRWWMEDSVRAGETNYRISEALNDGNALFEAAKKLGIEGILAKNRKAKYVHGKRSDAWVKIKVKETRDCFIIGFTKGEGDRERFFGSLQLAEMENNQLIYRGRVGTGFDDTLLKYISGLLKERMNEKKPMVG